MARKALRNGPNHFRWRYATEVVKRHQLHAFEVLPRRWVVERILGRLGRHRRSIAITNGKRRWVNP